MTSYTSVPIIPTLAPTTIYDDEQQPLKDQLDRIYTDTANTVNDKKRRDAYYTTEEITNDVWVDNKAIYTKTLRFPDAGNIAAGANVGTHGITGLAFVVDVRVVTSDGTTRKILPFADPVAGNAASVNVTATQVVVTAGATFGANQNGYAILYYTKT